MKVDETYILHHNQFIKIRWLYDFVFGVSIPSNKFYVLKIYKTSDDKWFVETPTFTYGNTTTQYATITEIPKEIINLDDLKL